MTANSIDHLSQRLFQVFRHPDFLAMRGQANEVPIFIQTYEPKLEDSLRRMVEALANRLASTGLVVKSLDLFELVLEELEANKILERLLLDEARFKKAGILETLQNYSHPKTHLIPRLIRAMGDETQLTLITGSGRLFPFLRTHTILESLQPAMLRHPVVIFFPGIYEQARDGGSYLRLFGEIPIPAINNPHYRATNLDHYKI